MTFYFEDTPIQVTFADRPTCCVYLRDLPVEISDASVRTLFEAFGDVFSVCAAVFKDFSSIRNGTHILLMSVKQSIPSSSNVLGFMCRTFYVSSTRSFTSCLSAAGAVNSLVT